MFLTEFTSPYSLNTTEMAHLKIAVSRLVHLKCGSYYVYTTRFHVQKHSFLSSDSYSEVRLFPCPESTHLFLKLSRGVLVAQNELNPGLTLVLKGVENVNVH